MFIFCKKPEKKDFVSDLITGAQDYFSFIFQDFKMIALQTVKNKQLF